MASVKYESNSKNLTSTFASNEIYPGANSWFVAKRWRHDFPAVCISKMILRKWVFLFLKYACKRVYKLDDPLLLTALFQVLLHNTDVIMTAMASQIISRTSVYSTVYSGADQRKYQSSASLSFVRGIHRWPVNSPRTKGPWRGKCFHLTTSLCRGMMWSRPNGVKKSSNLYLRIIL